MRIQQLIQGAIIFACISTIISVFVSEIIFKDPSKKFEAKILLNFFIAGLLVHISCEVTGLNKLYCSQYKSI
jgi:hypothetical protein